jgi:CDP-glucose 4,6-dehydratase
VGERNCAVEEVGIDMTVSAGFWQGKRVLLTGHTGFKGGWLSLWLQSIGADLCGLSLVPPTTPNLFSEASVGASMKSLTGDIGDYETVRAAFADFRPEIIIHMAAQSLVRQSYKDPVATYATNVMGTVHVLEAARQLGTVKAIVNVTTDKCYENKEWVWGYREDEPMGGYDPYSNSKACSELVSNAYRKSFFQESGIALATVRAGNAIGGGDWAADRLVPDILRAFERNQPVVVRNPHATRPWQHVLEPLSGYLMLAQRLYIDGKGFAEGWNFGPSELDVRPVQWIVENMARQWGEEAKWQMDGGQHPHEANYLKLDISKARSKLGWTPRWTLEESLLNIIEWHKRWLTGEDVSVICLEQIQKFNKAITN